MKINFEKSNGLVPVIVQHYTTSQVLMLGYMNQEAYDQTVLEGKVTFFSRSKNRLWTKGESSGHFLIVIDMMIDCDQDTVLIKAQPAGPVCHTGSFSCFGEQESKDFLYELENRISKRIDQDIEGSYTNALFKRGINKVAQKVGEEAVELVIEAKDNNKELFINEAADLMYHFLILLKAKGVGIKDVEEELQNRSQYR